jgi:hypothetical protein
MENRPLCNVGCLDTGATGKHRWSAAMQTLVMQLAMWTSTKIVGRIGGEVETLDNILTSDADGDHLQHQTLPTGKRTSMFTYFTARHLQRLHGTQLTGVNVPNILAYNLLVVGHFLTRWQSVKMKQLPNFH